MATKVIMPQLGESVVEGTVTKWLRQEGEEIKEFDSLLEINTDKVDTEIPSPASGTVLKVLVPEGETVRAGTVIAWIGEKGEPVPGDGGGEQPSADSTQPVPVRTDQSATQPVPVSKDQAATQPVRRAPSPEPAAPAEPAPEPGAATSPDQPQPAATSGTVPPDTSQAGGGAPVASQQREASLRDAAPPADTAKTRELGFISPVVARLASDHKVDLAQVKGTGGGGRITKKDVLDYIEQQKEAPAEAEQPAVEIPAWETPADGDLFRPTEMVFAQSPSLRPEVTAPPEAAPKEMPAPAAQPKTTPPESMPEMAAKPGEGQLVPLTPVRKAIAEHMLASKRTSPHVTTVMEADMSRVVAHLEANREEFTRDGARLTYTAYFVAATVAALRAVPLVNSSWTDQGVRIHPQINVGVATSLGEEGLIVPVIKGAEGLSLLGLARAINDLAERARAHRLHPEEVKGGTFTITNHGISGSLFAAPIINQPQAAILGVGAIQKRVVVINDAIAIRPMVYVSLTFDHRILDGASADGFLSKVVETLQGWK